MQIVMGESPHGRDHWRTVVRSGDRVEVASGTDGGWRVLCEGVLVESTMTRRGALRAARRMLTPPERVGNYDVRPAGGGYWMLTTPGGQVVSDTIWGRWSARADARRRSTSAEVVTRA